MTNLKLISNFIKCEGCAKTITKTLNKNKFIKVNFVDPTTKEIDINYDQTKITTDEILNILADINYPATIK